MGAEGLCERGAASGRGRRRRTLGRNPGATRCALGAALAAPRKLLLYGLKREKSGTVLQQKKRGWYLGAKPPPPMRPPERPLLCPARASAGKKKSIAGRRSTERNTDLSLPFNTSVRADRPRHTPCECGPHGNPKSSDPRSDADTNLPRNSADRGGPSLDPGAHRSTHFFLPSWGACAIDGAKRTAAVRGFMGRSPCWDIAKAARWAPSE